MRLPSRKFAREYKRMLWRLLKPEQPLEATWASTWPKSTETCLHLIWPTRRDNPASSSPSSGFELIAKNINHPYIKHTISINVAKMSKVSLLKVRWTLEIQKSTTRWPFRTWDCSDHFLEIIVWYYLYQVQPQLCLPFIIYMISLTRTQINNNIRTTSTPFWINRPWYYRLVREQFSCQERLNSKQPYWVLFLCFLSQDAQLVTWAIRACTPSGTWSQQQDCLFGGFRWVPLRIRWFRLVCTNLVHGEF